MSAPISPSVQGKCTIVYIDDEPEALELIHYILRDKNFELITASEGREGLELVSKHKPHLVLLDLMMPDMDGWAVYQQMKIDDELKHIPVIIVTAKSQSIDKVLGLHVAKVDDYITKPFSSQKLLASINKVLGTEF
jgi:two-component system response regulator VicR